MKLKEFFETTKTINDNFNKICDNYRANISCKMFIIFPNNKESQFESVLNDKYESFTDLIIEIDSLQLENNIKNLIINDLNNTDIEFTLYTYEDTREIDGNLQLKHDDFVVRFFVKYDMFY